MNEHVLVLDHVAYDAAMYGDPKVIFKKDMPGNFISNFSYSPNSLNLKNNLNGVIGRISNLLLKACLENPELAKRYLSRSKIGVGENGNSSIELFTCKQIDDTYVFTSDIFGVEVSMTDTGKNFIFAARSRNSNDKHDMLQSLLEEVNSLWKPFTKEIVIGVKCIHFTNEKGDMYGYPPYNIASAILKYMPDVDSDIGLRLLQSEDVLDSFHSFDNKGVPLFNLYGVDIFFRFNLAGSSQVERQATAVKVSDDKVLMRSAFTSGGTAELVLRASYNPFQVQNMNFDYAEEQDSMRRVARIIHLGLSQWAEGDFERLGKDIK